MRKPPFKWTAEDRARLKPGRAVVRMRECHPPGSGNYSKTLLVIARVHGDTVFFERGDDMFFGRFGTPSFFGEDLDVLDPKSLLPDDDGTDDEDESVAEPEAVH